MRLTFGIVLLLVALSVSESELLWQRLAIHKAAFMVFGVNERENPHVYMHGLIIDRQWILLSKIACEIKL